MAAEISPPVNALWTIRKGVLPRLQNQPAVPAEYAALFPEFEIGAPITQGGEQVVYQAQVQGSMVPCLLLFIDASRFQSPEHRAQFLAGMAFVQSLPHPNLLSLLWTGERAGHVCLGYEAFSGESLLTVVDHFFLDPNTVVGIAGALGEALYMVHQKGLWHRDLNPGWILLNRAGVAKIIGLGVAQGVYGADAEFYASQFRRPDCLRGYLAPEQMTSEKTSNHLTDVYALGAVTYEMLVGNPPSGFAMPPSSRATVGTAVDQAVFRAMHNNVESRYQTAAAFGADIQAIYASHNNSHLLQARKKSDDQHRKLARQRRFWLPALLSGILVLGGAGAGLWYYLKPEIPDAVARNTANQATDAKLRDVADRLKGMDKSMTKEQKEFVLDLTASLMRGLMDLMPGDRKVDGLMAAAELLMQGEEEEISLDTLMKLQKALPPNSPDWRRVVALTQLLRSGRDGYKKSNEAAQKARDAGDLKQERLELARAGGYLPGHLGLARLDLGNSHNPVSGLDAVLSLMKGNAKGGPVQYAVRTKGLEIHVDLAGNPLLADLSPLTGFPITHLDISGTGVVDLNAIGTLPLQHLRLDGTPVTNLAPVTGGCLSFLSAEGCAIAGDGRAVSSPLLVNYRYTLADGTLCSKISTAHWGRAWANSQGMSLYPIAARSRLLVARSETPLAAFAAFSKVSATAQDPGRTSWIVTQRVKRPALQASDQPATRITWKDAQDFCAWLTSLERNQGFIPGGATYRLLTNREWNQMAGLHLINQPGGSCLAGAGPMYQFSGNLPPAGQLSRIGLFAGLGKTAIPAPGALMPRLTGILGLGNGVQEWCQDALGGKTSGQAQHLTRDLPRATSRWTSGPRDAPAIRSDSKMVTDDTVDDALGFRIVLELPYVLAYSENE